MAKGFAQGWLQKRVSPVVNFKLFLDVYLKVRANGGGFLWSGILVGTVFCNSNCSLACVRSALSGLSPGIWHRPGFNWAGRKVGQDLCVRTGLAEKNFLLASFILSQIQKFQFLMIILGKGSRFHLCLAQLKCWRKVPWWETDPFPAKTELLIWC